MQIADQIMKVFSSTKQMNSIFGSIDLLELSRSFRTLDYEFQSKNFSYWQICELAIYVRNFFKYYVNASKKKKFLQVMKRCIKRGPLSMLLVSVKCTLKNKLPMFQSQDFNNFFAWYFEWELMQ